MRSVSITMLTLAMAGGAAQAQFYSNTLGDPGFSGSFPVSFAAYDDGTGEALYTTGQFGIPGVSGGSNIARWDGNAWQGVGGGLLGSFSNVITVFNGDLIAGGNFDSAGGVPGTEKLARWDGTQWHSMDAQSASFLNSMWDLEVYDDGITGEQLYIGGNYQNIGGVAGVNYISKWDGTTYTEVGGTIGGAVPLIILDIAQGDLGNGNMLFAGGRFLNIDGVAALNVAQWDGTQWTDLDAGISRPSGFAQVLHMVVWDDGSGPALYVGGRFETAGGLPVSRNIAKWDGSSWSSMGGGFNADVQELIPFDDGTGEALYALGNFDQVGGNPVSRIARWNGTSWEPVGSGANGTIFGGTVFDYGEGPSIVLGGGFTRVDGLDAGLVAAYVAQGASPCPADLNGDGNLDFFDVSDFINAFAAMDPIADFNMDGNFDFFDVSDFIGAFGAGCP